MFRSHVAKANVNVTIAAQLRNNTKVSELELVFCSFRIDSKSKFIVNQVCIPVGCVPPACCPYLSACTAPGGGGVCSWGDVCYQGVSALGGVGWGCLLPGGVYPSMH